MPASTVRGCPTCGQKNRVPARRLAETARCGRCKTALPPPGEPVEADAALFDEVLAGDLPVLVDFWATWCGPCKTVAPELEKVARIAAGKAVVLKVDIDRNPALAARFQVTSVPTLAVFKGGKAVTMQPGAIRSEAMLAMLQQAR